MATITNDRSSKENEINYFGGIRFILKVVGVNLDGNDSTLYRFYSILVIVSISIMYPIFEVLELFKHTFSESMQSVLRYLFPFFMAGVKTVVITLKRNKFGKLLDNLQQEPFAPNPKRGGEKEEMLMQECVWYTTMQARVYWTMFAISLPIVVIASTYMRLSSHDYDTLKIPLGPLTIFNFTASPIYEITCIYQSTCAVYLGLQFFAVDLVIGAALAHISYQFRLVQANLRRIVSISYEKMHPTNDEYGAISCLHDEANSSKSMDGSIVPWQYLKIAVKEAVDYHLAVINLADEMEIMFSGLMLTTFITNLAILCFMVYSASWISLSDPSIANAILEALDACFQVAQICYWGEQVLLQSQEVGSAAYESNFVGTDIRFQKSLNLIIRRSQNPSQLTAGKFSVVCLATFVWVMRASYSAFMMLKNTNG